METEGMEMMGEGKTRPEIELGIWVCNVLWICYIIFCISLLIFLIDIACLSIFSYLLI